MQGLAQRSIFTPSVVSDFMFAKDAIFARLTLGDEEYRLYRSMYEQVARQVVPPDLIVWLQAPPAVLQGRIRQRAIAMEQHLPADYLERLCNGYAAYFGGSDAAGGPAVLAVATDAFDPGRNDGDLRTLLARLEAMRGSFEVLQGTGDVRLGTRD